MLSGSQPSHVRARARSESQVAPHLFSMTPARLVSALAEHNIALSTGFARKILAHTIAHARPFSELHGLIPKQAFAFIESAQWTRPLLTLQERARDPGDGFVKYLFLHEDGAKAEAVRIPLEKPARFTVCLSSQVGCAMQCGFCATGKLGLTRNLRAEEIVAALQMIRSEAPGRVSGAVFMGQGEPFHNYDEVIAAAEVLADPNGCRIAKEAITISTVGLVPQIHRYAREAQPYRLIVSLTSAVAEKRKRLLPVAGNFSLAELRAALEAVHAQDPARLTLAWVLMGGVNHDADEVAALTREFAGLPLRVNLVDLNAEGDAMTDFHRRASDSERNEFISALHAAGIATQRRYSGGRSKNAACGMLAAKEHQTAPSAG